MLPMLTLDKEQQEAVDRMTSEPTHAALVASDTGTGKTLKVVELSKAIAAQTILIIGPVSRPVVTAWKDTFERQGVTLPFRQIATGTPENFELLRSRVPGVYYVGREYFALSATSLAPKQKNDGTWTKGRKALWSWAKVSPDLAVFDEVQVASNRNSTTYNVLRTLKNPRYKIAASATPGGNRFAGMWSITRWLWPDTRKPWINHDEDQPWLSLYVDNSFWRWAAQWAVQESDPYAGVKVLGEQVEGAFVNSLPCYIRMEAERTPVETRKVYVELSDVQRRLYDEMEADMLTWLDENPLVADLPIVQRIRLRQITLGEVTFNDAGEVDFDNDCESSKIDAIEKIISKHHPDDPILLLVDSQKFARVVTSRLGSQAAEWSGKVSAKERERIFGEFGKSVKYIVAVVPAVAEGLDGLQKVCNTEIWISQSLNEMLNEQARGRLNRRGQEADQITRYYLLARQTDDDGHFQSLLDQHLTQRRILRKAG